MRLVEKFRNSFLATSLCLNGVFLFLFIIFGSCRFSSMDDFFMSSILTGVYGSEYDVHLYFVNAIYGYFLKPFYYFFPTIGWYYIFEIAEVFASFVAIVYVILSRLELRFGGLLSLLLLSCVSPSFYFQSDFTRNAALLTAVGMLLLTLGGFEKKKFLAWGVLFALAGFVMRKDAFYLGTPCLGVMLLFRWVTAGNIRKVPWMNIAAILACCLLAFAVSKYDKKLYQNGEYKYYAEYQGPRAVFGDGMYYDYDAAIDEIEERGFHGIDFELLTNWVFYDTDVLKKDSLYKFINVINRNRHDVVLSKMPISLAREFSRSLHEPRTWIWVLLCVIIICTSKTIVRIVPWFSLGYVVLAYTYLLMQNRVVPHVEASIWIYATVSMIPFLKKDNLQRIGVAKNVGKIVLGSSLLLYVIGVFGVPEYTKAPCFQQAEDARWSAFMQFEKSNPDKIFFFDFTAYKRFVRRLGGGFESLPPGRLNHIIPLGYWNVHLPGMRQGLKKLGIENPMREITRSDAYVVQYLDPEKFIDFLNQHYAMNFDYQTLLWTKMPGKEFISFDVRKYFVARDVSE